jgi:hypothetical protein
MPPITYASLTELIESKGCKLMTSEEDFDKEKVHCKRWFEIEGKCGHASLIKYDMFKAQGCGVTCKDCAKQSMIDKMKVISVKSQDTEYEGFCYARNCLEEHFDVFKCVEGTTADFLVRPKGADKNEWLPIQLKVTSKPNEINSGNYYFAVGVAYVDMCILCVCLEDKRMWLFEPGYLRSDQLKVAIGKTRSKYTHCESTKKDVLKGKVANCYRVANYNATCETLNTPRGKQQQREQQYRQLREKYLPGMKFQYPEREGLVYDFTVDGKRVQEKVATKNINKDSFLILLSRRCDGKKGMYQQGDADYFWFNIPGSTTFYLIPEADLIERGIVSCDGKDGGCLPCLHFHPGKNNKYQRKFQWVEKYIRDYNHVGGVLNIESILSMEPCTYGACGFVSVEETTESTHKVKMAKALGKSIQIFEKDSNKLLRQFMSMNDAARCLGIASSTFQKQVAKGESKQYVFKLVD